MNRLIRTATEADATFVHDVYGYYVDHSDATFSTENPDVESYREKIRRTLETYPFLICEADGAPCGFAYGAQIRPHEAYRWDVEATLYLAPDAPRRAGHGSALYRALLDALGQQGFKTVYGVITDCNEPSLALHRAMGFSQAGHFRNMGFKRGRWLGVIWMQLNLGDFSGAPEDPIPYRVWRQTQP
ncbi:MAG: N-acetyltransferase [Clostridiales bacterium]|nr:N-acetyltransferase [Clostridiales bacterium]